MRKIRKEALHGTPALVEMFYRFVNDVALIPLLLTLDTLHTFWFFHWFF